MAKLSLLKGTTSYRAYLFVQDSSVSTGAGKTGLAFNTGSLVGYYVRPGAAATAITLATQTVTGAYSSGGFVEVDSANMPGLYRLDVPDAALATGVNAVVVMLKGAANMAPVVMEIELTATDNQTAVQSVNATQLAGQTITAGAGVTFPSSVASPTNITAGTITNVTNLTNAPTSGDLTATMKTSVTTAATAATPTAAAVTGAVGSVAAGGIAAASFAAGAIDAAAIATDAIGSAEISAAAVTKIQAGLSTYAGGAVASVTAGVTVTTNNDKTGYGLSGAAVQAIWDALTSALTTPGSIGKRIVDFLTGDAYARLGAPVGASLSADIAGVQADTDNIQSRLPAALVGGRMDSSVGAMAADVLTAAALASDAVTEIQTGLSTLTAAGVRTAVGLATANLDTQLTTIDDFLDTEVAAIKAKTDNLPASPANEATLTTIAGYLDTEVAAILAAVDTEVAAIKAKTDLIPASPAAVGDIPTANANADALLDRAAGVETNRTVRQAMRLMLAVLAGEVSGAATTTVTFRDTNDSVDRVVGTVDSDGNRSSLTYDAS